MSIQAMAWALKQTEIKDSTARYVLLCLANYANEDGIGAFPSSARLSLDSGLAERTIRYKLDALEEMGLIGKGNQAIAAAYISRGDRRPTVYDLYLKRGAGNAPGLARGASETDAGCSSERDGVQLTTERGAPDAPNPSSTHQLTTIDNPILGEASPKKRCDYPDWFEEIWAEYPTRAGGNDKRKALQAANARIKEGRTKNELLEAVKRYRYFVVATGRVSTEYVKMAASFFGPNSDNLDNHWTPPPQGGGGGPTKFDPLAYVNRFQTNVAHEIDVTPPTQPALLVEHRHE